jgi:carbamoyltransferase
LTSVLGISAFYHDSAAALLIDGKIVAAAQEERFSRKKYDAGFPRRAVEFCLREAGLQPDELDYVGFYDKPYLKFERLLETYLAFAPRGFFSFVKAMPLWLRQKLHLPREIDRGLQLSRRKRYVYTQHHESHAASAFFPSPFEEAAVLTVDGVGEWATASYGFGRGNRLTLLKEMRFPHSLGLLYSAFTYYTGFTVNSGEYKLMGLAPYGVPRYVELILDKLIDLKEDGSLRLDLSYFNYCQGLTMTSEKFHKLFGGPPRQPDTPLTQRDMDVAASIQRVTEEAMLRMARCVHAETGLKDLCLAGGVALNCVANGRIQREGPFSNLWIQPAAGDAGGALGVALFIWHQLLGKPRTPSPGDSQAASLLGPAFSDRQIESFLENTGVPYTRIADDEALCQRLAGELAQGKVLAWFQGPMEFGPRALGSRSLLGDPRRTDMQAVMNLKVKFREGFRPFAPAVLREHAHEYFEVPANLDAPYMLLVAPVHGSRRLPLTPDELRLQGIEKLKLRRSTIPAVTHVDYSARLQTVDERHGLYRRLLEAFHRQTDCPVLVNTSFNLGWEPIVCTPREAYETFMSSDIDVLCLGHYVLTKADDTSREIVPEAAQSPRCQAQAPYESLRIFIERQRRDAYARTLQEAIPFGRSVLEVGCGTGELSNFLGVGWRTVIGTDQRLDCLRSAEDFRRQHGSTRVRFLQMNPRHPCFQPEQFDLILDHQRGASVEDRQAALRSLAPLLAPGGYFVVAQSSLGGQRFEDLFADCGLRFIRAMHTSALRNADWDNERFFLAEPAATNWELRLARARQAVAGQRDFFVLIGQKPGTLPPIKQRENCQTAAPTANLRV